MSDLIVLLPVRFCFKGIEAECGSGGDKGFLALVVGVMVDSVGTRVRVQVEGNFLSEKGNTRN